RTGPLLGRRRGAAAGAAAEGGARGAPGDRLPGRRRREVHEAGGGEPQGVDRAGAAPLRGRRRRQEDLREPQVLGRAQRPRLGRVREAGGRRRGGPAAARACAGGFAPAEALDQSRRQQQLEQSREDEQAVARWVHAVTGDAGALAAAEGRRPLEEALQSGEALCDLVNAVWPGQIVGTVRGEAQGGRRLLNITRFVQACPRLGVRTEDFGIVCPIPAVIRVASCRRAAPPPASNDERRRRPGIGGR
ncbi:unnamed protein product, partial [Prorocentrum cordatum]